MSNTESRGPKRLTWWFRRANKPSAKTDVRPEYYEIVSARVREFQEYLVHDGADFSSASTRRLLTDTHLTACHIRSLLRFEDLHKLPLETLEAVRVLVDEELPNLVRQARRASASMDHGSVDELFRQGVIAIHLGLHQLACLLTELNNHPLIRHETDDGLELRRQVAFLRLKYDGQEVRTERERRAMGTSEATAPGAD